MCHSWTVFSKFKSLEPSKHTPPNGQQMRLSPVQSVKNHITGLIGYKLPYRVQNTVPVAYSLTISDYSTSYLTRGIAISRQSLRCSNVPWSVSKHSHYLDLTSFQHLPYRVLAYKGSYRPRATCTL